MRFALALLLALVVSIAGAQTPVEPPLSLFNGDQAYCKVEAHQGVGVRSLCFVEYDTLSLNTVSVSVANRVDLLPSFAVTPLLMVSVTQTHWWVQTQVGFTVLGDGGWYGSVALGVPLP